MVTRLAALTLAAGLLASTGCSMFGGSGGSGGGWFSGLCRNRAACGDCCDCCDPCACPAPCGPGGCGVVSNLPPNMDGPLLTPPPGPIVSTPPPPMAITPGVTPAPLPRVAPIPQTAPAVPYTP